MPGPRLPTAPTASTALTTDLLVRFREHLRAADLFEEPGRALLAVSGGADSRALLELFVSVAEEIGVAPVVGHVDHGIGSDSPRWADAVHDAAVRLGVPCDVVRLHLGAGTSETVARDARYEALRALQRRHAASYLVTAHHADDQVETVLLRVLRGSGVAGLAGIRDRGPGGLRRPLLPFRRTDLEPWLDEAVPDHGSILDPANLDPHHDRSWVRQHLLPMLRERLPDVDHRLVALARDAADHRAAWAGAVRRLPELAFHVIEDGVEVARPPLRSYDKVLSETILRVVAREAGCVLGPRRAARLVDFAAAQSGRVMPLGDGWTAELVFDRLRIHRSPVRPSARPPATVRWGETERGEASWDGWGITWGPDEAHRVRREGWFTWVTRGAGVVRALRSGDRMRPLGGIGRRKVRRLLIEGRVPRSERSRWPVLERDGDILWVPGICRSASALPRPGEPALRVDAHRHGNP